MRTDWCKPKYLERNLLQCLFAHHKTDIQSPKKMNQASAVKSWL